MFGNPYLDGDGSDVLAPGGDQDLLNPARDGDKVGVVAEADVACGKNCISCKFSKGCHFLPDFNHSSSSKTSAVLAGLFKYPIMMLRPRMQISPRRSSDSEIQNQG